MGVRSLFLGGNAAKTGDEVYLEPLGLKLTELLQIHVIGTGPKVRGGTVMKGNRFGRDVLIPVETGRVSAKVQYPDISFPAILEK